MGMFKLVIIIFCLLAGFRAVAVEYGISDLIRAYNTPRYEKVRKNICKVSSYAVNKEACDLGDYFYTKDEDRFLRSVQVEEFWSRIYLTEGNIYRSLSTEEEPYYLSGKGLVFSFLGELQSLVWQNNDQALALFLELGETADGEAAEYYDEILTELFTEKMPLLLNSWSVIKKGVERYSLQTTNATQRDVAVWKKQLKTLCAAKNNKQSCREFGRYLNSLEIY